MLGPTLVAISVTLLACGGTDGGAGTETTAVAGIDREATAVEMVDQFDQALRALNARYQFTTTLEVEGAAVSQIVGRNIDGNTTTAATVAANTIDVTGVGVEFWIRTGASAWVPAANAPASQDPLAALLAVTEVTFFDGSLSITYPGAALGFEIGWVTAQVNIVGPSVEVVAVLEGLTGRSTLSPAIDLSAITAPY